MSTHKAYHRQIHLDFHTSEHCTNIGGQFDEAQFIGALKAARVDSINLFAQCHHGWVYYEGGQTGWEHPHLQTDLLGRQVRACREAGINPVIYITVGWNDKASREHPEWVVRNPDGSANGMEYQHPDTARPWGWDNLCSNTRYLDESVLKITREVMALYQPEGLWYDITREQKCTCSWCRRSMETLGLDWTDTADLQTHSQIVYQNYLKRTNQAVWDHNPEAAIYHNSGLGKFRHDLYEHWSHFELESLPTGGWGYDFFPPNARYYNQVGGKHVIGMTGKFHRSWGEFGGFKNPLALRYEVAQMGALNTLACVGDQLHPEGAMDMESYRLIGAAYRDREEREPWLTEAQLVADVALMIPTTSQGRTSITGDPSELGASQMLMELNVPHHVIDATMDLTAYRLLILPDYVHCDAPLTAKLKEFVAGGGALILSGESGLDPALTGYQLDVGARFDGVSPWDVEYIQVSPGVAGGLVTSPFLSRCPGVKLQLEGAEVLADAWQPYFSRTYGHFCGHLNTPNEKPAGWPAVVRHDKVVVCAHHLFKDYSEYGMQLHRDLIANCLALIYPQALLSVTGLPSAGRVSLTEQPAQRRTMIHALYASPIKRGNTEVIEDIVPLHELTFTLRMAQKPSRVYRAPAEEPLVFTYDDGKVRISLPKLLLSEIIVVEY